MLCRPEHSHENADNESISLNNDIAFVSYMCSRCCKRKSSKIRTCTASKFAKNYGKVTIKRHFENATPNRKQASQNVCRCSRLMQLGTADVVKLSY